MSKVRKGITKEEKDKLIEEAVKSLTEKRIPDEAKNFALEEALYNLIYGSHNLTTNEETRQALTFLGHTLQSMNISYNAMVSTVGVHFDKDTRKFVMYINPVFFVEILKPSERCAVLCHELYHIIFKHCYNYVFQEYEVSTRRYLNIAMDMVINQYIDGLPESCIDVNNTEMFYDDVNGTKVPWKKLESTEFYYDKLINMPQDQKISSGLESDGEECDCQRGEGSGEGEGDGDGEDGGNGGDREDGSSGGKGGEEKDSDGEVGSKGKGCPKCKGKGKGGLESMDDHGWDSSVSNEEQAKAASTLINRTMQKMSVGHSKVPKVFRDLLKDIDAYIAELNYKAIIMSALKRSVSGTDRKYTYARPSRRYGVFAPGQKTGDLPFLSIFVDSSGSISYEELSGFMDIIDQFLKVGSKKVELNMFHTSNYLTTIYKRGSRDSIRDKVDSGGTDLTDSLKRVHEKKPDLSVFITDGYYDDVAVESWLNNQENFPQVVFVISKGGNENHPLKRLGQTIKVPENS